MKKTMHTKISIIAIASLLLFATISLRVTPVYAASCVSAGGTGLTTLMVAHSHQTIKGTIDATGCDIGIFVGPGTTGVTINHATITGANDHGIFAQDASGLTVENSVISGNGALGVGSHGCNYAAPPCIAEDKGLQLVGTTNSLITNNLVSDNAADGGIAVADDGPSSVGGDPGAPVASATVGHQSQNVSISGNSIVNNWSGCGIVIAAYDAGVGVNNIRVYHNTVVGIAPSGAPDSGPYGGPGSFFGQIVVATDGPNTRVSYVQVVGNYVDGSLLPGIAVHANVFGDKIDHLLIKANYLYGNGYYPSFFEPPGDTNAPLSGSISNGISLVAEGGVQPPLTPNPVITHTTIASNTVVGDNNGVWLCFTDHTMISHEHGNPTNPLVICPAGVGS